MEWNAITLQNELIQLVILLDQGAEIVQFPYKPTDLDFIWRSPNTLRNINRFVPVGGNGPTDFLITGQEDGLKFFRMADLPVNTKKEISVTKPELSGIISVAPFSFGFGSNKWLLKPSAPFTGSSMIFWMNIYANKSNRPTFKCVLRKS